MATSLQIKDHWAEQRLFTRRVIVAGLLVFALSGIVVARLAQLQIAEYDYFSAQSQGNRIRVQPAPPTRGLIFDRNGQVLAENIPTYQLELTPEQVPDLDATLEQLAAADLIAADDVPELKSLISSHRRFDSVAIRQRLDDETVARFAVDRPRFPGVEIRARLTRAYPLGKAIAHAVGYVGGISVADRQALDSRDYAGTALVGKVGVERGYEDALHGNVGHADVLVNARGRMIEVLDRDAPEPGNDLILTLDAETQLTAWEAMAGRRGAVVAIDPRNGEVLVLVSTPAYDPNGISAGLTRKDFRALQEDPDRPLFNRAVRGAYPPGSTIKPVLGLAGLDYDFLNPEERHYCGGFYRLPGKSHRYRDWKPAGHGPMDLHNAIAQSCDVYFYALATEMGIERMAMFLRRFGLGADTGVDIPGEKPGLVPDPGWKRAAFSRREDQVWFPGETVIAGIGQGYMLTTPMQLAHLSATIAARGKRFQPTLLKGFRDPETNSTRLLEPESLPTVEIKEDLDWDRIISAMNAVLQGERGTARSVGMDAPFTMAGKSGTAQVFTVAQDEEYDADEVAERMRDHALFIAFAPLENPSIAVAVVIENGESGSRAAAPVARAVMENYLEKVL
jgi:penicillin-binding protein 2